MSTRSNMSNDVSEVDTDVEDFIKSHASVKKNTVKRVKKTKVIKPKIKISGIQSHLALLEKKYGESCNNEENVVRLKKSCGGTFSIKIPSYDADEYFILQKFKTEEMANKEASERWKAAHFCGKCNLNTKDDEDEEISIAVNKVMELVMNKFMNNPKKNVTSFKK